MNEQRHLDALADCNAVLTGHFVYASGKHGEFYVNKDALYAFPSVVAELCADIAQHFYINGIGVDYDVVVGPEKGGIILSQWVAYNSVPFIHREDPTIHAVYAEKEILAIRQLKGGMSILLVDDQGSENVWQGEIYQTLMVDTGKFVIKRGYDKLVAGKKVLIVEDVLTTGGSVKKVVEAVRAIGGEVVAVAALCNRGKVTSQMIGDVPELFSLINLDLQMYDETDCPLCQNNIPVNTNVGKGKEFLAKKQS